MKKSGQSLPWESHQKLSQGKGDQEQKNRPIEIMDIPLLKIINNTVIFGNYVYQIKNICNVELAELKETSVLHHHKTPTWCWLLVGLGLVLMFFHGLGIFILVLAFWLFSLYGKVDKSQIIPKGYGLKISMSSGEGVILISSSKEFILKIIVTLFYIMNTKDPKAVEFNFKTLTVEDKPIKIDQTYSLVVLSGKVTGNVVNMV